MVTPLIVILVDLYGWLGSNLLVAVPLIVVSASVLTFFDLLLLQRKPQEILSVSKFLDHSFSRFWLMMGAKFAEEETENGVPALVSHASGTIIELGPGSGCQVHRYDPKKVTKIYGLEPCKGLHAQLRENAKKAGLSDVYTIVPCGVEDVECLRKYGVDREAFDTVLSIQVLCSVPNQKETVAALYRLLKPGGQMIVYEHVKSRDFFSSFLQTVYMLVWPYLLANCHLDRDTAQTLRDAGKWAKVDLQLPTAEDAWQVVPRIKGRLIKAA
ncbi:MAG: hypothetical protein Q9216_007187 [Gyalolechia sp. 2 TL-2023]